MTDAYPHDSPASQLLSTPERMMPQQHLQRPQAIDPRLCVCYACVSVGIITISHMCVTVYAMAKVTR